MSSKKNNPAQRATPAAKNAARSASAPAKAGSGASGKSAKARGNSPVVKTGSAKAAAKRPSANGSASLSATVRGGAAKGASAKSSAAKGAATKTGALKVADAKAAVAKKAVKKDATAKIAAAKAASSKGVAVKSAAKAGNGKADAATMARDRVAQGRIARLKVEPALADAKPNAKKPLAEAGAPAAKPVAGAKSPSNSASNSKASSRASGVKPAPRNDEVARQIQDANEQRERQRDLSQPLIRHAGGEATPTEAVRDRVVLLVRDPYWLQASWEITRQSVQRAQAAMAEQWHSARPILRVFEVDNAGMTSPAERLVREIAIHGGVHNWYIDVQNPPRGFRVEIGYLSSLGKFFAIARSNIVSTPRPGSADSLDENWSDVEENYERIFAQSGGYSEETNSHELQEAFEERLQRPIGPPLASRFGVGAERILRRKRDFQFDVDAEMVVHGQTKPDAHVTLSGEPVKLRTDGSFAVRMAMPDKRQVIPVVASSRDGVEQRTIVIAVERNTKVMEPMIRESNE